MGISFDFSSNFLSIFASIVQIVSESGDFVLFLPISFDIIAEMVYDEGTTSYYYRVFPASAGFGEEI